MGGCSKEKPFDYESAFVGPTTVIEYRKGRTPPVLQGSGPAPVPAGYVVPNENTMFLSTSVPRNRHDLPSFVRVTWRSNWNQAMLSTTTLVDALIGLATTPGLGLHSREKPAPVYWADGIAGVHDGDLRFAGNASVSLAP